MVTKVKEPYLISRWDVDKQFDGRWVLLHYGDLNPTDGEGYLIAYGSDNEREDDADWDALEMIIRENKYGSRAELLHGYKNRGSEMLHVL
jgi:hypothetical protein